MIVKPLSDGPLPSDPALRAGVEAERQLAHYLHRAFAASDRLFVLHDLRIEDPAQPESTGAPGVCQIDQGKRFIAFAKESRVEIRKVVWPTRQETQQTTLVVVAIVLIAALILWALDSLLGWLVSIVIG